MQAHTKTRPIERVEFLTTPDKARKLRAYAAKIGAADDESIPWREAFPEFKDTIPGTVLRGFRERDGLTQTQLALTTGIPQNNISAMERGKRPIGKETARKLAKVFKTSYRVFL